jgi:putative ABC transport system permease protein
MLADLRYAFRILCKSPAFTAVSVIALALGIGANTAIFSVVNSVLIRPLPYKDPDQLVRLFETEPQLPLAPLCGADFLDWREQNHSFTAMAQYIAPPANLTGSDQPSRVIQGNVSPQMFSILGVAPAFGRDFLAEEEQTGRDHVAILSHAFWQQHFTGERGALGRTLTLNGETYSIIGVMPQDFQAIPVADLWTPLNVDSLKKSRGSHSYHVVARLKAGVTVSQGEADLQAIAKHLEQVYPQQNSDIGARAIPLLEQRVGSIRPVLLAMLGAVAFVLLIAVANVANLLLARASVRQREMAVRSALGATRWRLIRQLLTESVLLSLAGGMAGLALAYWGVNILRTVTGSNLPRLKELTVDGTVLSFTLLVSVITGILFGLAPAWQHSGLNAALKEGGRGSTGMAGKHLRSALVVAELALSLVLLIGSGLMVKSFLHLLSLDLGFDTSRVLTMNISLPSAKYKDVPKRLAFYHTLLERVGALPGVTAVAATSKLPLIGGNNGTVVIEGQPAPAHQWEGPLVEFSTVTPDYFRAMGIPVKMGRVCSEQDSAKDSRVTIINETMARRFWPNQNPLHKGILDGGRTDVIGVVGDVRQHGLEKEALPEMYFCYGENANRTTMALVVRGDGDPTPLTASVRSAVQALDKDQPVYDIRTMEKVFQENSAGRRFQMLLFGIFAAVALVLAAVGIYGVMSYMVTQRSHEIGIRMALGAQTLDVMRMVVGQGMRLVACGVALGLVSALLLGKSLAGLLYGVRPSDPQTLLSVSALLSLVAFAASYIPAWRATRVDPVIVLRHE